MCNITEKGHIQINLTTSSRAKTVHVCASRIRDHLGIARAVCVCVTECMTLVVESALSAQLNRKVLYKYQSIYQ